MKNQHYTLWIDGLLANDESGYRKLNIILNCSPEDYEKYLQSIDKSLKIVKYEIK